MPIDEKNEKYPVIRLPYKNETPIFISIWKSQIVLLDIFGSFFINSGEIIKIYQRDSLGLGEPYSTSLKDINIYNIISFKTRDAPEGKSLRIDTISQNSLNAIEK